MTKTEKQSRLSKKIIYRKKIVYFSCYRTVRSLTSVYFMTCLCRHILRLCVKLDGRKTIVEWDKMLSYRRETALQAAL